MDPHVLAKLRTIHPGARGTAHVTGTPAPRISTRTQARPPAKPHASGMLWSDPENEPPKELRDMQDMLRRLSVFLALAMVLAMIVLGLG
ncbi:hypothetical protein SMCF_4336 [Streptomyces coelicoflavus ZG0656]|nr:hypothetical protein SMCF_4336 [Streptomyces coelicoflavus ZG0656]